MAEAALLLLPESAAERDAREKLSLWDWRPDSVAPLTDRQTDSVLELKAAVENLPVPAEVSEARAAPGRPPRAGIWLILPSHRGGSCGRGLRVPWCQPATAAGPAKTSTRGHRLPPPRRGTVGLSLACPERLAPDLPVSG